MTSGVGMVVLDLPLHLLEFIEPGQEGNLKLLLMVNVDLLEFFEAVVKDFFHLVVLQKLIEVI